MISSTNTFPPAGAGMGWSRQKEAFERAMPFGLAVVRRKRRSVIGPRRLTVPCRAAFSVGTRLRTVVTHDGTAR